MKRKPFIRSSGTALLYPCVFIFLMLLAACAGGDKKQQPQGGDKPQAEAPMGEGIDDDGPEGDTGGGDTIPIAAADTMINTYSNYREAVLNGTFRGEMVILPLSETFRKSLIERLLDQRGVDSLRIYFAMDTTSPRKIKVILVGVDKDGRDIMKTDRERRGESNMKLVVEDGDREPK
jgi:hypothetical protein